MSQKFKVFLITSLALAFILATMPWMTGPYLLDVIGTWASSVFIYCLVILIRKIYYLCRLVK